MPKPTADYYYSGEEQKMDHHVAPGSTITGPLDQLYYPGRKKKMNMKATMIALVVALVAIVTTATLSWKQRIITALVAAAIAVAVSLFVPGCMATTDLDGKVYSWRMDILAPIGATVAMPTSPAPASATTQPAK